MYHAVPAHLSPDGELRCGYAWCEGTVQVAVLVAGIPLDYFIRRVETGEGN